MARELAQPPQAHTIRPTHEQVAERAYQIFLERGSPQGHDQEHWFEAEAQLTASEQRNSTPRLISNESSPAPPRRVRS